MIGTIRRHSAVLWWVIVIAVIVSFVAWTGNSDSSLTSMLRGSSRYGEVDGHVLKQDEILATYRQVQLQERLSRRSGGSDSDRGISAAQLAFIDRKMRGLGIVADDEVLANVIRESFKDPTTGQSRYPAMLEQLKALGQREEDYLAIVRRQIEQGLVANVLSIPGALLTPRDAEMEFRRENEEAVASAVFFLNTNFLATVNITPEGLGTFFTNRSVNYRIPEKLVVSYIRIPGSNHVAAAEAEITALPDLAARLEQAYSQRPTNSFVDDQGVVLPKDAALARIKAESIQGRAAALAGEAANEVYNDLAQISPATPESLETVAAKRGLRVEITQPFSRGESPFGLEGLAELQTELQKLSPDVPFSEPIVAKDGAYIVAIKTRIPSTVPPLDSVRARVTEDYRQQLSREAARSAGQAFHSVVTNALASGKTFAAVAAEQKLPVTDLPPFSISSTLVPGLPPYADLASLKDVAFGLEPGKVSNFNLSRDGGFVLFLKERKPVSAEKLASGLPAFLSELRGRQSGNAFGQWFMGEWENSSVAAAFKPDTNSVPEVQ